MVRKFADIAFTPTVKGIQRRYGSRARNARFEQDEDPRDSLTRDESAFLEARDGFYQATVSETGWPYVQFRGGPPGFLKVLDARKIAYPDFRGNMQYLSVGNIAANDRVSLIFVDYVSRGRLKIWGRAHIVHPDEHTELLNRLHLPGYRARIERAVVVTIEAIDWNCPQHIPQRFTQFEVHRFIARSLSTSDPSTPQRSRKDST